MKVELNLEEINEAIELYLRERKLSGYTAFEITDVEHHGDGDENDITATAVITNKVSGGCAPSACPVPAAPRVY